MSSLGRFQHSCESESPIRAAHRRRVAKAWGQHQVPACGYVSPKRPCGLAGVTLCTPNQPPAHPHLLFQQLTLDQPDPLVPSPTPPAGHPQYLGLRYSITQLQYTVTHTLYQYVISRPPSPHLLAFHACPHSILPPPQPGRPTAMRTSSTPACPPPTKPCPPPACPPPPRRWGRAGARRSTNSHTMAAAAAAWAAAAQ